MLWGHRPYNSPPKPFHGKSDQRRRILWAILAVVLLAFVIFWLALPVVVTRVAALEVEKAFGRFAGNLSYQAITVEDFRHLRIENLIWHDEGPVEARLEGIEAVVDPLAFVFGGPKVREVLVKEASFRLGDAARPFEDMEEIRGRFQGLLGSKVGGEKEGFGHHPWPNVTVSKAETVFWLRNLGEVSISLEPLTFGPPSGSIDASGLEVEGVGVLRVGHSRDYEVKIKATWTGRRVLEAAAFRVNPPIKFTFSRGEVAVSGAKFEGGRLLIEEPNIRLEGLFDVKAEAIEVVTDKEWKGEKALAMLREMGEGNLRAIKAGSFRSISILRPAIVLEVKGAQREIRKDEEEGTQKGSAFEGAVKAFARKVEEGLGGLSLAFRRLSEAMPADEVRVVGAGVQFRKEGPESLANLNLRVVKEAGKVEGSISFECPEAAFGANKVQFELDPQEQSVRGSVTMGYLPLSPYYWVLPSWLIAEKETALRDWDLKIVLERGRRLRVEGSLGVSKATFLVPVVASVQLKGVDMAASGRLLLDLEEGRLAVEGGVLQVGQARLPLQMDLKEMQGKPKLHLEAQLERIRAEDLVQSIPKEAIPALEGVRLSGSFAAKFLLDIDAADMSKLKVDIKPDVADLRLLDPGRGVNLDLLRTEFYHRIVEDDGRVIERKVGPSSPSWVGLEEVPTFVVDLLTISEDAGFFEHHGFSLAAIRRSLRVNLERGGLFQGGSTISQQLAKNLFLDREKTLARKLQEAFITWQLERYLSKEKILELYLNVVEWGPEVYGLREAAMHYFGKKPEELDPLEAAYLVSILPNPIKYHRYYEEGVVPAKFERRVKGLLWEMVKRGSLTKERVEALVERKIRFAGRAQPDLPEKQEEEMPEEEFSDDG